MRCSLDIIPISNYKLRKKTVEESLNTSCIRLINDGKILVLHGQPYFNKNEISDIPEMKLRLEFSFPFDCH